MKTNMNSVLCFRVFCHNKLSEKRRLELRQQLKHTEECVQVCMCVCMCEHACAHANQWSPSPGMCTTRGSSRLSTGPSGPSAGRRSFQGLSFLDRLPEERLAGVLSSSQPFTIALSPTFTHTAWGINKRPLKTPVVLRVGFSAVTGEKVLNQAGGFQQNADPVMSQDKRIKPFPAACVRNKASRYRAKQ